METLNAAQRRVAGLLKEAAAPEALMPWIRGRIPNHYKRLSIDMDEACRLAELGAGEAYAYFGTTLHFTQAVLFGAVASGKYKTLWVVTPSQYGKSWLCGQIALWLANKGRQVYTAGADTNTAEIVLGKVMAHVQTADEELRKKLLESLDKLERLQTAVSKKKLSFRGGGFVEGLSLGESFKSQHKGNMAIGRGGDYFIDEASLISENTYAELGRREFANESGEKYISLEISNIHNPGRFYDNLTTAEVPDDCLIVWMDARTALEEGRFKSKEQILGSEFFKNKSTCIRYLLCELEDYTEESLFTEPQVDDSEWEDCQYFLGIDSAYKGKDNIKAFLCSMGNNGALRLCDHVTIHKAGWVDGETGQRIILDLAKIIKAYNVRLACIDIGYGVYIVEGLAGMPGVNAKGINFGAGTTKGRKDAKHYSAVYGENMRAEMHLDMQDLMESKGLFFTREVAEALKDQMNAVRAVRKRNGKTGIIPKEQIKQLIGKSPDELDAALLAVHAAILYTMTDDTTIYTDGAE